MDSTEIPYELGAEKSNYEMPLCMLEFFMIPGFRKTKMAGWNRERQKWQH